MKRLREKSPAQEAPLYIRWAPVGASYAIELKLELVSTLLGEMAKAERANIEIGGALIGSFPNVPGPSTLCIEELAFIPRRGDKGSLYILDPGYEDRLDAVRERARAQGCVILGLFRSNLRPGTLSPALADRSIVLSQFEQSACALFLIQGRQPYSAAFFVAKNGRLPEEATVREFRLDEDEFNALPEIYRNQGQLPEETKIEKSRLPLYRLLAAALVIVIALFAWGSWRRTPANQLGLKLSTSDGLLKISWDHSARAISNAQGATLVIQDGRNRGEVKIGLDELRLGSVEYQPATAHVGVTISLDASGSHAAQSADWTAQ